MIFNFLLANFNLIALVIWEAFFVLVVLRLIRPHWVKSVSYGWLIAGAVAIHVLYGIFATWGQYVVWGKSEFTKVFLSSPLASEVPFPSMLELLRPLFDGTRGYFAFYSFQHFFLSTVALLFVTGMFVLFFKVYSKYRPANFEEDDIAIITLAFLIAGWQGAAVLVPLSLSLAVVLSILNLKFNKINQVSLATSFLVISPFALLFATSILTSLNLYNLLKL